MVSSVVERLPYKQMVTGSNPVPSIINYKSASTKKVFNYSDILFFLRLSRDCTNYKPR